MDKISIILPVYNVEEYLERCLASLVNQTYKNIEIIIVNDGSPDNSQSIIDRYKEKDPCIISLIKENGGLGDARNYGMPYATGEYIIFIDSDDYVEEDMLEKLYTKAVETDSDIVMCNHYIKKDDSCITNPLFKSFGPNLEVDRTLFFQKPAVWDKLYKKSIIKDLKFVKGIFYEDIGFLCKVLPRVTKMTFIDEPLYYYIIRSNSIMNAKNLDRNFDIAIAFEDIIKYYKDNNLWEEYKDEIRFLITDQLMISAYMRVLQYPSSSRKKEILKNFRDFNSLHNPDYMKNPYIKSLSFNRKVCLYLCYLHLDSLALLLFRMKRR